MRSKIRKRTVAGRPRWYVSIIDEDGTERAHGGYARLKDAKDEARRLLGDASVARYVAPGKLTLADYLLGEWIPSRENADLSPQTRDTDRTVVESWIVPHIGDVALQRVTPRTLDRLYATLRASGGRGGKPLRGKSVRNVHVTLSKALGDAVRRGHIATNPVGAVDPPARDDSVERAAWSAEEVRKFLDGSSTDRLAAIWRLALATGLRRGELLGLRWEDLDLDAGTVAVARQILVRPRPVAGAPRVYVRETTKSRRRRLVRFDRVTAAMLRRWKADQAAERLTFGPAWRSDGGLGIEAAWIVTEPDGAVINPETLLGRWRSVVRTAGVPEIPLHGARHSYAETALRAGARLDVVSRQLGHASIATTANIYLHDADDSASEVAELLGTVFDARGGNLDARGGNLGEVASTQEGPG
jgi:integrase